MDSVLVPLGNLRLEGEIQINDLETSITELLSSYLKSCNSEEIRISWGFFYHLVQIEDVVSGQEVLLFKTLDHHPLAVGFLWYCTMCITVKVLKLLKYPTWRCCQPKAKFICHTLWNISDEVIHMSVKIKMSPWTRPDHQTVLYYISKNKHSWWYLLTSQRAELTRRMSIFLLWPSLYWICSVHLLFSVGVIRLINLSKIK